MKNEFKEVSIYIDISNNIYALPIGINPKFDIIADLDKLFILNPPYDNEHLERFLLDVMEECYTDIVEDINAIGALAKYFKVKKWDTAVKNLKYISFDWLRQEGYRICFSKKQKRGYSLLIDQAIKLGFHPEKGEIAKAFYQALEQCE